LIYICIPTFNEGPTIGVLLWRIRRVFQDYSREYEIIVYDDASTDSTLETLAPYADVIPLTILRGETRGGYGRALEKLCREVSRRTRYARRDAAIVMQGDFTDQPEYIPELVKRFEGGADIVAPRQQLEEAPAPVRTLHRLAGWIHRAEAPRADGADPYTTFRIYRISVLRELLKSLGDKPLITASGWAANKELLLRATRFARRVETIDLAPRYDLRIRESRVRPLADAFSLLRFSRRARALAAPAGGAA
jgi:glycosyltransferase involved in cell wall biosynthesis